MTTIREIQDLKARRQQEDALIAQLPALQAQEQQQHVEQSRQHRREALLSEAQALLRGNEPIAAEQDRLFEEIAVRIERFMSLEEKNLACERQVSAVLLEVDNIDRAEEAEEGWRQAQRQGLPVDANIVRFRYTSPRPNEDSDRMHQLFGRFATNFQLWNRLDLTKPYRRAIMGLLSTLRTPSSVQASSTPTTATRQGGGVPPSIGRTS